MTIIRTFLSLCLLALGTQLVFGQSDTPFAGSGPVHPTTGGGAELRFRRVVVRDPMAASKNAVRFMIPEGWKVEGGIEWHHDWSCLTALNLRFRAPEGAAQVEFLPSRPFCHSRRWVVPFPEGSNYMGNEVQPPLPSPKDYVLRIVQPRFRSDVRPRFVSYTEMPKIAEATVAGMPEDGLRRTVRSGKVRWAYEVNGRKVEEDVYVTVVVAASPFGTDFTLWKAEHLFALRAEEGGLDALTPLMMTTVNSARVELAWFAEYLQVVGMWMRNQQESIRQAGLLSRYLSRVSSEISDLHRAAWKNAQAGQDRIHRNFSNYLRGVESYHSPHEAYPVRLPAGYDYVWTSGSGEYLLTNQAGFDPNAGGTATWRLLERTR